MIHTFNNINSTNAKIFAGILFSLIVVCTACGMEIAGKHFNEILLLELLTFCATWAGISYAQFRTKRTTEKLLPPETTVAADNTRADNGEPAREPDPIELPPHPPQSTIEYVGKVEGAREGE